MTAIPVAAIRWVITCDLCGDWSPLARTQRGAFAAARDLGWSLPAKGTDRCRKCASTAPRPAGVA